MEPSDFIEYQLDLPTIPDNLIFNKVSDIQNNCEVVYDAYMYKTYKAPQELHDWLHPYMENVLKLYLCLLYTSPSPRDRTRSRMPSSA